MKRDECGSLPALAEDWDGSAKAMVRTTAWAACGQVHRGLGFQSLDDSWLTCMITVLKNTVFYNLPHVTADFLLAS